MAPQTPSSSSFVLKLTPQNKYATFGFRVFQRHPAVSASLLSKLFISWCMPLVKREQQLNMDDIWTLQDVNTCELNTKLFTSVFDESASVIWSALQIYGSSFMITGVWTALIRLLELVGPMVLRQVVASTDDMTLMYRWLVLLLLAKLSRAFLSAHTMLLEETLGIRFIGALKGLLFRKLLSKGFHKNDDVVDLANAYSADMDALLLGCKAFHNLWIMPIQIAIASLMLYQEIGAASFAGMGVIALVMGFSAFISRQQSDAYRAVANARDNRMQMVKETFGSILIVKLLAWERRCRELIQERRQTELNRIWKFMLIAASSIFSFWAGPLFVSTASFAAYTLILNQPLTASKVFTSMALFRLLQIPLSDLPMHVTSVLQARVSLQRVFSFLNQVEKPMRPQAPRQHDPSIMVVVDNGSFAWSRNAPPVLKNIALTICRGDLVVVHGKVGSGKSSLCLAILGELYQTQGTTGVYGSIAYCSQEPWIQQMSVRDNILFGSPFDSRKYNRVVEACGLLPDFAMMAYGDLTEAGSKGHNLSGGQRARISLARACYSDADIIILDAPLAAIDAVVQKEVMTKCIETLLATKTVILVTHSADIISSASVNRLVKLEDGVMEHFQRKASNESLVDYEADFEASEKTPLVVNKPVVDCGKPSPLWSPRTMEAGDKWAEHFDHAISEQMGEEERAIGRVGLGVYASYITAFGGWSTILLLFSFQTTTQVLQVSSDVWLGYWTSNDNAMAETKWYLGVYTGLCFGMMVAVFCRTLLVAVSGVRASRNLFEKMLSALLNTPMSFFDATPIGRVVNRFAEDVSLIDIWLPFSYAGVTAWFFSVASSLLTAMIVVRWCGLLFLPLIYVYVRIAQLYLRPSRELTRLWNVTHSPVLSYLDEVEHGFMLIRAFGQKYLDRAVGRHAHHVNANHRVRFARISVNAWFELCIQLQGTAIVMVVAFGLVFFRSVLTAGMVGLAFNYILMADANIGYLVSNFSWLEINMVGPERVLEYCNLEDEDPNRAIKAPFKLTRGSIEFSRVQFQYKESGELVLRDLTCSIRGGEKIGIVGRTGAGKSSLTMVLFCMYPVTSGSISIDGRDISTMAKADLRRQLSIIPQSPVLFKGTLRQYLDPFGSFDDATLWSVVSKAGLKSLVSEMPQKLSTELAEKGSNLSVGERQMLCLARALLVQSKIVVLDEATAAMDHETDLRLQHVISTEFADATVLTIAHRLHTVMHSDRIMVMDAGCVVEMDSPAKLLAMEDGVFRRLAIDGGVLTPSESP
ncbi:unnamed protein product [Aphanomyces euteiches]|uniref:Multidrug resistance-associated protein 1 n=1 Tax=Aphanomyces euteiches TaxID=100861 RepID=A0A6G0XKG5_9STRA|nr:hypothetical protein Ae201684_003853 [Aphanomyces euteiches]KAH9084556.1 hypothetical protein Ae201684P_001798 [Aphanomyces euteiches]KAH9153937.1 hypothetical protein AeRB84_003892 [Aphanomyces euteiches]